VFGYGCRAALVLSFCDGHFFIFPNAFPAFFPEPKHSAQKQRLAQHEAELVMMMRSTDSVDPTTTLHRQPTSSSGPWSTAQLPKRI
jgi:hypothetical protein